MEQGSDSYENRPEAPMFITSLKVNGFKSYYREACLQDLGPGLHVIVGPNGSGKSNLLAAIDITLNDTFAGFNERERRGLLSSQSRRNQTAHLEVQLDDNGKLLPFSRHPVVTRQLGFKGDCKASIDDSRFELSHNPLRLFRTINSFYYVSQGQVARCVFDNDAYRLQLIKEATAYSDWVSCKDYYKQCLEEHNTTVSNLENDVAEMEEKYKEYEVDLQCLEERKQLDKRIKTLNFYITKREYLKCKAKSEAAGRNCEDLYSAIASLQHELKTLEEDRVKQESEMVVVERTFTDLESRKTLILADLNTCHERAAALQVQLDTISEPREVSNALEELTQVEQEIVSKTAELDTMVSEQQSTFDESVKLLTKIDFMKEVLGRGSVKADSRFKKLKNADLAKKKHERDNLQRKREVAEVDFKKLNDEVSSSENELHQNWDFIQGQRAEEDKRKGEEMELRYQQSVAMNAQAKNWEKKVNKQRELEDVNEELSAKESSIKMHAGKSLSSYKNVPLIIEKFKGTGTRMQKLAVANYVGTLLECITFVPPEYRRAVEVSAGRKMFFHVVKNSQAATEILKEYNKDKHEGEVNFLVEDKLFRRNNISADYVLSRNAQPLLPKIEYSIGAIKSMEFVFGSHFVCRDIKDVKVDHCQFASFVSIDGDIVKSSGPITGGYRDPKKSVLRDQEAKAELLEKKQKLVDELGTITAAEVNLLKMVDTANGNIVQLERDLNVIRSQINTLKLRRGQLLSNMEIVESAQSKLLTRVTNLLEQEKRLEFEIAQIEADISKNFSKSPTDDCQTLDTLKEAYQAAKSEYDDKVKRRRTLEAELSVLKLKRRHLSALLVEVPNNAIGGSPARKDAAERIRVQLYEENIRQQSRMRHLNTLTREREAAQSEEARLKTRIEKFTCKISRITTVISKKQAEMDKASSDRFGIFRFNLTEKLRALDLPTDDIDVDSYYEENTLPEYISMTRAQLYAELSMLTEEQRQNPVTLRSVGIDAENLSNTVKYQKERLRLDKQLAEAAQKLLERILHEGPRASMWVMKNIQNTLPALYTEILQKSGDMTQSTASITLYSKNTSETFQLNNADTERTWGDVNFVGARLEIERSGNRYDVRSLSGGQRTVLAAAFILALQKNCPINFFLFDEIDQALDERYRSGIVKVLKRFCAESGDQFFCTTFSKDFVQAADRIFLVSHGDGNTSRVREIDATEATELPFLSENSTRRLVYSSETDDSGGVNASGTGNADRTVNADGTVDPDGTVNADGIVSASGSGEDESD